MKKATLVAALSLVASTALAAPPLTKPAKIVLSPDGVLLVDGQPRFPINLTVVPGPEQKAPDGRQAYAQFADDGVMFMRTGKPDWNPETIELEKRTQAAAAAGGMRCAPWLGWDMSNFPASDKKKEAELVKIINTFKDSPGMGLWKAADEPAWGNSHDPKHGPPDEVINVGRIIRAHDPNHAIWLVQAPRNTVESMRRYNPGYDIGGIDIYPISYPPGVHTELPNKDLSMVGDWTRFIRDVCAPDKKPYWMTLQIAFSGTVKPGRTLRFPTFAEQRFMAYEAIINGARGLTFFGGGLPTTLNERDKPLGFNWTYWNKVMMPLMEEIGPKSPLTPALVAANSKVKLTLSAETNSKRAVATKEEEKNKSVAAPRQFVRDESGSDISAIEFLVRETPSDLYVLACMKEGPPALNVRFNGVPKNLGVGQVMFEEPRKVEAKDGSFTDWFCPHEVHVYRFAKGG